MGRRTLLMVEGLCRQNEADWLELEKKMDEIFHLFQFFGA